MGSRRISSAQIAMVMSIVYSRCFGARADLDFECSTIDRHCRAAPVAARTLHYNTCQDNFHPQVSPSGSFSTATVSSMRKAGMTGNPKMKKSVMRTDRLGGTHAQV